MSNLRIKFYFSLFIAFFVITINHYAGFYNVYFLFPWFDIPMHVLGGLMAGLFAQYGLDYLKEKKYGLYTNLKGNRYFLIILFVVIVGVVWEIAEWYLGLTDGLGPLSRFDTIKDIINDIIGGALAIWFWIFLFNKKTITKIHDKKQGE